MSLAIILTRAQSGIESPAVTVEVHISNGLPSLTMVGLPETAVKESRDRVRSALLNSHFDFPARRITVNLAPADLPKEGGRFDLPIALGILAASGQIPGEHLDRYEFLGELALSGELRPVSGIFPSAIAAGNDNHHLVVPTANGNEAALADQTRIYPATHLLEVCAHLNGSAPLTVTHFDVPADPEHHPDLQDVIGQPQAKRVLEIAAAGGHNLLFSGPPGSGKSMLASRLPSILPPLTGKQMQEVCAIHSVAGHGLRGHLYHPPYRAPHHSASATALVGGGSSPRPGEISLAHQGILFLDELPEFPRQVLEVLREPLESGEIMISRVRAQTRFPARFQLVAAMNPCPCGHLGSEGCRCTPDQVARYRQKISGPLLDRIDLQLIVPRVPSETLLDNQTSGETSAEVRKRVIAARDIQNRRNGHCNAHLTPDQINTHCKLAHQEKALLLQASERLKLSARGVHRVIKVARTIADLSAHANITTSHLSEALSYRLTEFSNQ